VVVGHFLVPVWLFQRFLNHLQCEQGRFYRFCCSEHGLESLVRCFVLDHEGVAVEALAYEAAPVSLVGQVVVVVVQWQYSGQSPLEEASEGLGWSFLAANPERDGGDGCCLGY